MPSRLLRRSWLIVTVATVGIAAAPAQGAPASASKKPVPTTSTTTTTATTTTAPTPEVTTTSTTTMQAAPTTTTIDGGGPSTADDGGTIVFSDRYLAFIAAVPSGWAGNACEAEVALSGRPGVCTAEYAPVTMYPDGSYGTWPWYPDPSSSTGWSIDTPCDDPNVVQYDVWAVYVDWFNYGVGDDPGLTDEQVAASGACFGWWW